jgi:hypothetical protein
MNAGCYSLPASLAEEPYLRLASPQSKEKKTYVYRADWRGDTP